MTRTIKLLWTGGWDSSFRLLQLLVIEKSIVQPIYVIDANRKSLSFELKTMEKIISLVNKNFPEVSINLQEIKYFNKNEAVEFNYIKEYFNEFQKNYRIGHQYLWLAMIAEKHNLNDLEIGQEKVAQATINGTWLSEVLPLLKGKGHDCRVDYNAANHDKFRLFKYYRYPLFEYTKQDMAEIAKKNNFYEILKYAWFCHYPIRNRPCGLCRPCIIAKRSGQLTIHKFNSIYLSKGYQLLAKIEKRFLKAGPFI